MIFRSSSCMAFEKHANSPKGERDCHLHGTTGGSSSRRPDQDRAPAGPEHGRGRELDTGKAFSSVDLLNSLVVERMLVEAATSSRHRLAPRRWEKNSRSRSRPGHHRPTAPAPGAVGLWLGDTENKTFVTPLLDNLVARGDTESGGGWHEPWPTRSRQSTHQPPPRCATPSTTCLPFDVLVFPARCPPTRIVTNNQLHRADQLDRPAFLRSRDQAGRTASAGHQRTCSKPNTRCDAYSVQGY